MKLAIVIVNYRTADLTVDCLRALSSQIAIHGGAEVIVVDGASGDDSVSRIAAAVQRHGWDWVRILPLTTNGGFAFANNAAIQSVLTSSDPPEYLWLLNADTIPDARALTELVDFMDSNPHVGIAGSKLENADGSYQDSRFRFPGLVSEFELHFRLGIATRLLRNWVVTMGPTDRSAPADWVSGASLMIRREVFDAIGSLDDTYFLYYEETDFCLQARRHGWSCWHVPSSRVTHLCGQSTGVNRPEGEERPRPRYWFESRRRYFQKNHGHRYAAAANLVAVLGLTLWHVRRVLQRKPRRDPPGYWRDLVYHSFPRWTVPLWHAN